MSVEFFSEVVVAPPDACRAWAMAHDRRAKVTDVGPPDDDIGSAYVDMDMKMFTEFTERLSRHESRSCLTSNYPALVAIDRAVALPHGFPLFGGRAARHVANDELDAFRKQWRALLLRAGGAAGIARACRRWLDRGTLDLDELTAFIEAIGALATQAQQSQQDLYLVGLLPP